MRTSTTTPATLSGPVTIGKLSGPTAVKRVDLDAAGYIEEEFFAEGVAAAYDAVGELTRDGAWTVALGATAGYKTRLVVRRPGDASRFNGSVVVEWFNVSGGVEADPDWAYLGPELRREGYAYVGVTAQALGINGGKGLVHATESIGAGLPTAQPDRYGSLVHPGDRFCFDIYSQVGAALRDPADVPVLGGLSPERFLAVGESQSAIHLTTYANAMQPTRNAYDGIFIHSRGSGAASLDEGGVLADDLRGTRIRDDLEVPVFIFETETDLGDLLDYRPARQPDTDMIRVWEVAGTAHADAYLVGSVAEMLGCHHRINEGPHRYVVQAAFHAFERWVAHGTPPPGAPPIEMDSVGATVIIRDEHGNAVGGVRTPSVDEPVAALSGEAPPGASVMCSLFGSTTPFDDATLQRLHGSKGGYLDRFERSLDRAIDGGFVLEADRDEYLAEARAVAFPTASGAGR